MKKTEDLKKTDLEVATEENSFSYVSKGQPREVNYEAKLGKVQKPLLTNGWWKISSYKLWISEFKTSR